MDILSEWRERSGAKCRAEVAIHGSIGDHKLATFISASLDDAKSEIGNKPGCTSAETPSRSPEENDLAIPPP